MHLSASEEAFLRLTTERTVEQYLKQFKLPQDTLDCVRFIAQISRAGFVHFSDSPHEQQVFTTQLMACEVIGRKFEDQPEVSEEISAYAEALEADYQDLLNSEPEPESEPAPQSVAPASTTAPPSSAPVSSAPASEPSPDSAPASTSSQDIDAAAEDYRLAVVAAYAQVRELVDNCTEVAQLDALEEGFKAKLDLLQPAEAEAVTRLLDELDNGAAGELSESRVSDAHSPPGLFERWPALRSRNIRFDTGRNCYHFHLDRQDMEASLRRAVLRLVSAAVNEQVASDADGTKAAVAKTVADALTGQHANPKAGDGFVEILRYSQVEALLILPDQQKLFAALAGLVAHFRKTASP